MQVVNAPETFGLAASGSEPAPTPPRNIHPSRRARKRAAVRWRALLALSLRPQCPRWHHKFFAKTVQTSFFSTISFETAACGDFPQFLVLFTTIRRLRLLPSLSLKYFERPQYFQSRLVAIRSWKAGSPRRYSRIPRYSEPNPRSAGCGRHRPSL